MPPAPALPSHGGAKQAHGALPHPSLRPLTNSRALPTQLVELKNGETFNGHLVNCDNFMNITLREVYQTNADGDVFWKLKECYIRGSTVRGGRLGPGVHRLG